MFIKSIWAPATTAPAGSVITPVTPAEACWAEAGGAPAHRPTNMRSAVRREHFANCFLADDAMMSPYANFFFHRHIRKAVANEQTAPTLTAIGSIPIPTLALKVIAKLVGFYYWRHLVSRGKSGHRTAIVGSAAADAGTGVGGATRRTRGSDARHRHHGAYAVRPPDGRAQE